MDGSEPMNIEKILVLSTGHLSEIVAQRAHIWAPTFTRDEGWMWAVPSKEHWCGYPSELEDAFKLAVAHDCTWVLFDRDAEKIDELPWHEW